MLPPLAGNHPTLSAPVNGESASLVEDAKAEKGDEGQQRNDAHLAREALQLAVGAPESHRRHAHTDHIHLFPCYPILRSHATNLNKSQQYIGDNSILMFLIILSGGVQH